MYCSACGEELDPYEEREGICESCKLSRSYDYPIDDDVEFR